MPRGASIRESIKVNLDTISPNTARDILVYNRSNDFRRGSFFTRLQRLNMSHTGKRDEYTPAFAQPSN